MKPGALECFTLEVARISKCFHCMSDKMTLCSYNANVELFCRRIVDPLISLRKVIYRYPEFTDTLMASKFQVRHSKEDNRLVVKMSVQWNFVNSDSISPENWLFGRYSLGTVFYNCFPSFPSYNLFFQKINLSGNFIRIKSVRIQVNEI